MRHFPLLAVLLLAGCVPPAAPPPADPPAPTVGRAAPPVAFGEWLLGDPAAGVQPGHVTVLDFWASWCGPCIQAMPHVQQVAEEFAGRATVIGVTVPDDHNTVADVVKVLGATKAGRSKVRHATIDRATQDAYGITAFPTVVVVGPDGRIAYAGSPMLVDEVVDRLLAGTWQGRASVAAVERQFDDLGAILTRAGRTPAAGVGELAAFAAAHPAAAGRANFRVSQASVLLAAGRTGEAQALTEQLLPVLAGRTDARHLEDLRALWASPKSNPERSHPDLVVKAAEALVAVEGADDPTALARLADALLFVGEKGQARAAADRALAGVADGSPLKKWLTDLRAKCE